MNEFQPLVIGNRVNFPELNRRIEIIEEDGNRCFGHYHVTDPIAGMRAEICFRLEGEYDWIKNSPNLKWRYADQNDSR